MKDKDFQHTTLWRISAFEKVHETSTKSQLLPTTLLTDLDQLKRDPSNDDLLEVVAACLRHHEPALLYLGVGSHVWPLTLFPTQWQYHALHKPEALGPLTDLSQLKLLYAERPGVRPPGHWMYERVAAAEHYHPLRPLMWVLALYGPRKTLLTEIGGRAAYRVTSIGAGERPAMGGALGPAMQRLRHDAASLRDMQQWPGMSLERASRLLNGLYLTGGLMVTRSHPLARDEPGLQPRPPTRKH